MAAYATLDSLPILSWKSFFEVFEKNENWKFFCSWKSQNWQFFDFEIFLKLKPTVIKIKHSTSSGRDPWQITTKKENWVCCANTYCHTTYIANISHSHKHITWTRAYTNTHVSQLKMSQEIFTIIKLMMQTYVVKPSPLHSKNPGWC